MSIKKLINYPNYGVDEFGNVYNIISKRKLSPFTDTVGYQQIVLYKNKKRKYIRVHRLMAEAFFPNYSDHKLMINHIDGNKSNNNIHNLELVTNQKNTQHAYDNNFYKSTYRVPVLVKNKITGDIKEFRSLRSLTKELRCERHIVSAILKGDKVSHDYPYYFAYKEESNDHPIWR